MKKQAMMFTSQPYNIHDLLLKDYIDTSSTSGTKLCTKIVHGVYYLYQYQDNKIKDLILKLKNGDTDTIDHLAQALHGALLNQITVDFSYHTITINHIFILILHAPSSSFGLGKKDRDHMATLSEHIADIAASEKSSTKDSDSIKIRIDIAPYSFRHTKPPKIAQHHKDRVSRMDQSIDRFELTSDIPPLLLDRYSYIYIVDDVVTTGSSLQGLKQVLMAYCLKHNLSPIIRAMALCH